MHFEFDIEGNQIQGVGSAEGIMVPFTLAKRP
jgi:hypothetical protein